MMKKLLLSILLTLLPLLASAETVEIDGIWYNLVPKAKEAEVTRAPNAEWNIGSYSGNIVIPASVSHNNVNYTVTSIGIEAFSFSKDLTSVIIPNSVISIGNDAFQNCIGLTSLIIPSSVTSIGNYAFYGSGLISINISSSVQSIGEEAFAWCTSLSSVIIPNSVTSIGNWTFSMCSSLTSVTIPNSVTSIGVGSFQSCSALSAVTIPNSVTTIELNAFCNCSSLTSVIIPNSVTSIGIEAFVGCSGLTSVTIPNSVKTICRSAFGNCTALTSVIICSGVTSINAQAFGNCDELTDVYCLADQVPNTNTDAFQDSYPQYVTLHVPSASIEAYRSTDPWSQFKAIVAVEDGDNPNIEKCATPEICYANGKLDFTCETEGVEFVSEVIVEDAKKYYDAAVTLSQTYKITVYATKAGYENSDVATREIVIENGQTTLFGDINKDGKVNVADHVKLSDIIMNK